MLSTNEILQNLENNRDVYFSPFIQMLCGTDELLDTRLNIFRHPSGRWAIAFEKLLFDPVENMILLQVYYYGNCLKPIGDDANFYEIMLADLNDTTRGLQLRPDAQSWLVRDRLVHVTHRKEKYAEQGIELEDDDNIATVEAARYLAATKGKYFRATDAELYAYLPEDLEKILVLNEWYHQDYYQDFVLYWPEAAVIDALLEMGEGWRTTCFSREALRSTLNRIINAEEKVLYSPSSYETWQMLAEVIVTGDVTLYAPTLPPNTHWSNWPGALEQQCPPPC